MNQFNRFPHLLTAIARRLLCILCAHYFDDCVHMDLAVLAAATKAMFLRLVALFQVLLSTKKSKRMSSLRDFLGHAYDMSALLATGRIIYGIKKSTMEKAVVLICRALQKDCLSPAC